MRQRRGRAIKLNAPSRMKTGALLSSPRLLFLNSHQAFAFPVVMCSCLLRFLRPRQLARSNLMPMKEVSIGFGDRATAAAFNSPAFSTSRSRRCCR